MLPLAGYDETHDEPSGRFGPQSPEPSSPPSPRQPKPLPIHANPSYTSYLPVAYAQPVASLEPAKAAAAAVKASVVSATATLGLMQKKSTAR